MMPQTPLRIQLLGGCHLDYGEAPLTTINTARLQSLLAYLLLHQGAPQLRQHVAFRLWPDTSETHARNNLRQALHQLRQALPEPNRFLMTDANSVMWRSDDNQLVDVARFERALFQAEFAEQQNDLPALGRAWEEAVALYQGDLLPSCYEEWIIPERERLHGQFRHACQRLVRLLETQNELSQALQTAGHLLRLDPLDEETYILLIRLHNAANDPSGVRRAYQDAVNRLKGELDEEPSAALREAYQQALHRSKAEGLRSSRADAAGPSVGLIGRQNQWQMLLNIWRRSTQGNAHFFLVMGEAGIGKSRLAEELYQWVRHRGFAVAYTRSYAAEGSLSLGPVTDWLRSEALKPGLDAMDDLALSEVARLLPELLTARPKLAPPGPISEYGQRQRFFEALARAVLAATRPLLLWIDDLQWCDLETLEWLHFLLRFEPQARLLLLGTARSEESPPNHPLAELARQLRAEGKLTVLELAPFDAAETAKLASAIQGYELDVPASVRLFRETEGNPLFVVEAVRAGIGTALANVEMPHESQPVAVSALPPRVHAVIAGRLAHLSPNARSVAELTAALGRALTLPLLLRAGSLDEESAVLALDELWQRRILCEQGIGVFDFTHDKLRDVAYAQISPPQRLLFHLRLAQALEKLNGENLDPISAQLAAQYEQAGQIAEAVPYYQQAGQVAARVYANEDAIALLTRALTLLAQLPPGSRRDLQELELHLALAPLYRITQGWTSPEVAQELNRALVLCDQVGDNTHRARTLYGLQALYIVEARLEKVQFTYAEMHKLFMQTQGNPPPPFAGTMRAGARLHMGELLAARQVFEETIAKRDSHYVRDLQETQSVNYLAHGQAWYAHLLWCLGYPQQALDRALEAVRVAHEFGQPFNQALAITYLAMLQEMRAPMEVFAAHAAEAIVQTKEYKAPYYWGWAQILTGFARAWQEPSNEHVAQLRDSIQAFVSKGAHLRLPYFLSLLARALLHAGQFDEGLTVIAEAQAEARRTMERWWDAELHRLRGELLWAQKADSGDVEAAFLRALSIAREQQALSLELRAAVSLARLWQALRRTTEARSLLSSVLDTFTEGFDTPDLVVAQTLLAQL